MPTSPTPVSNKPTIFLPFDLLPESIQWQVGKVYRIKAVLKQTGTSQDGATFEVADASSMEADDKTNRRYFLSEGGYLKS